LQERAPRPGIDPKYGFPRNPRRKILLGPTSKKDAGAIAMVITLLRIIRGPKLL